MIKKLIVISQISNKNIFEYYDKLIKKSFKRKEILDETINIPPSLRLFFDTHYSTNPQPQQGPCTN